MGERRDALSTRRVLPSLAQRCLRHAMAPMRQRETWASLPASSDMR